MAPKLPSNNAKIAGELTVELEEQFTPSEKGHAYKLAFADQDFLNSPEVRGIRFQLELLKPDLILRDHGINHTIVVFGSARFVSKDDALKLEQEANTDAQRAKASLALKTSAHYESARQFGHLVGQYNGKQTEKNCRLHICTGGGPGIMEAANRGASEAGDSSIGLNISLPREQAPNPYITPRFCFRFHYFALRKMHFMLRARAIVVYPGGFGSFDELFEVLTLVQTKKVEPMPVVLVGHEYWSTMIRFDLLIESGLIDEDDLKIVTIVESAEQAWSIIQAWYELG
ncbi:LOG family protein [Zwartia sp.]|uniref:LOG family protein n=1 Tax=Zwartia sp. TaxID=2978004 RepID=UPI002722DAD5|nr:LOG family protein [Zwartia sp.]MDO9024470.1 LOG family protein [Zwartia sp.]